MLNKRYETFFGIPENFFLALFTIEPNCLRVIKFVCNSYRGILYSRRYNLRIIINELVGQ